MATPLMAASVCSIIEALREDLSETMPFSWPILGYSTCMEVNPAAISTLPLPNLSALPALRIIGSVAQSLSTNGLLTALVTTVESKQAVLEVNGKPVAVQSAPQLRPGAALLVRFAAGMGEPRLEVVGEMIGPGSRPALAMLPGRTVAATVTQVSDGMARLDLNGVGVTIRADNLNVGDRVQVKLTANVPVPQERGDATTGPRTNSASSGATARGEVSRLNLNDAANVRPVGRELSALTGSTPSVETARVQVLRLNPNGSADVRLDGRELTVRTSEPLIPGGKYVVQIERSTEGVLLRTLPNAPELPVAVARAVLRDGMPAPALGPTIQSLAAELRTRPSIPGRPESTVATSVRETIETLLPQPGEKWTAAKLKNFVQDGGLQYEAKLASQVDGVSRAHAVADLKGGLLALVREFSPVISAHAEGPLPAAQAALQSIESLQALNVVSQQQGGPILLQIPFPTDTAWTTANLSIEPDGNESSSGSSSRGFRMLMHVELPDLGETWIDAGLAARRLRGVLYAENAATRDQMRAELGELRKALLNEGFSEVLLDVRAAAELPDRTRQRAAAMRTGIPESVSLLDVKA